MLFNKNKKKSVYIFKIVFALQQFVLSSVKLLYPYILILLATVQAHNAGSGGISTVVFV